MSLSFPGNAEITYSEYAGIRITSNLTVCTWFKTSTSQSNKGMLGRWGATGSYLMLVYPAIADRIRVAIKVGGVTKGAFSASTYNDGAWHHAALVYNGSNVLLKIDGGVTEDVTGDATAGPIDNPADSLEVGSYAAGIGTAYTGQLADAAVFAQALSNSELRTVMRHGPHAVQGDLRFYNPLYSTAYQTTNLGISSTKTSGTVTGTPTTADGPPRPGFWALDSSEGGNLVIPAVGGIHPGGLALLGSGC